MTNLFNRQTSCAVEAVGTGHISGIVFRIQKYAIHDGPGIRTLVFLKGCPLRCLWCCNPESWSPDKEIAFIRQRCVSLGKCMEICPTKAITIDRTGSKLIDESRCTMCGLCVQTCVAKALELIGTRMNVQEVINVLEQDRDFYGESGGVTLSGGEPVLQFHFSEELLRQSKKRRIHTALETCGNTEWNAMKKVSEFVDLFLYDIKAVDKAKHLSFVGVANGRILRNLERLCESGKKVVIRYPLIPGHNDDDHDIEALTSLITKLNSKRRTVDEADIMPYHRFGAHKYEVLGRKSPLESLRTPTQDEITRIRNKIQGDCGIQVKVGG